MSDFESKDYLVRHLESPSPPMLTPELDKALEKFCSPIKEIDFHGERDAVMQQGDISISFSWTPAHLADLSEDRRGIIYHYGSIYGLMVLDNFTVTNNRTNAIVTRSDILPTNMTVAFAPHYYGKPWTSFYLGEGIVILSEPLNIPATIASLFHEAGHNHDFKVRPEIIPVAEKIESIVWEQGEQGLTRQELEEFLHYERNAWAFALKRLKPFIGDNGPFPEKPLFYVAHNYSLHTKSEAIRENLQKSPITKFLPPQK